MKTIRSIGRFAVLAAMAALFAGCAGQQVKSEQRFFWPPLPERPRIEWLNAYSSQNDFPKSATEKFLTTIIGEEEGISLSKPITVRSDGRGKVYVGDPGAPGVYVFDFVNNIMRPFGKAEAEARIEQPVGIAIDENGRIYVSDTKKAAIMVFHQDETPAALINLKGMVEKIGDIAYDRIGKHLLALDVRGHKVLVLSLRGELLSSFGNRGTKPGEFNFPSALTVNNKGEIIVADAMNARIQIFSSDGKFLRMFGQRGDSPGTLQLIKGVAVDSDDNIYVTDGKGHKFEIFSTTGDYLLTVGGAFSALTTGKTAPGGFVIPQGIDIDKDNMIYVVDQLNRRFQVFRYISDSYLKANPIPGYTPSP
ncbi:NHL repeat containing protein [Geobacter metallireducens RCH3]|uniref:NHL repeat domain lipoprotein n=1 Tax=Geobacter metallireducens (strain ATCC 53774 / DSM 7210 / GS-15) TaxID=269799 RepID=Q39RK9_GEOMG|nr:6-bladed beta-propeller [Geobacter metallireducens]ABB33115.1 NHL repeat domain lipoprotein [Geobacter metallireducens GS-15]EHP87114.1 NHL repeat containing protein [Geobacter metallireducens RCH3]